MVSYGSVKGFPWDIYLRAELLGHRICIHRTQFDQIQPDSFPEWLHLSTLPSVIYDGFLCHQIPFNLATPSFLMIADLIGAK